MKFALFAITLVVLNFATNARCSFVDNVQITAQTPVVSNLILPDIILCRLICEIDPDCVYWVYYIFDDACVISEVPAYAEAVGTFAAAPESGIEAPGMAESDALDEGETEADEENALQFLEMNGCAGLDNVFHEDAGAYITFKGIGQDVCCNACEADTRCVSWNWNKKEKKCMLNKKTGTQTEKEGFYAGTKA